MILAGAGVCFTGCISFGPPSLEDSFPPGEAPRAAVYTLEDGGALAARETGSPEGPLILFVHGTPGSWNDFAGVMGDEALRSRAWMVSVDRPGWGGSVGAGLRPELGAQARALGAVLDEAPGRRPAILVGHSYGAPVAALLAMEEPERVGALVLVAGSIDPELEKATWYQRLGRTRLVRWMVPEVLVRADEEIVDLRPQLEALLPRWGDLTIPVVVIQGEKDRLVPPANADFAARQLSHASLEMQRIADQGHLIPWQKPELIRDALLALLEAESGSAPGFSAARSPRSLPRFSPEPLPGPASCGRRGSRIRGPRS